MEQVSRLLDAKNKPLNHIVVFGLSLLLVYVFLLSGISLNRAVAGASFVLLFLILIIGPWMQLIKPSIRVLPWGIPWSWRGELGIWFAILSVIHFLLVFSGDNWKIRWSLAAILGLVALFWTTILAITSFSKIIKLLGVDSWRWLHAFAYVIFYTSGLHVVYHAFLRNGRPSHWLHWAYLAMMIIVVILEASAFVKNVIHRKKA